jgi:hypothetical protein
MPWLPSTDSTSYFQVLHKDIIHLFHQKRLKYSLEINALFSVAQQIGGVLAAIITFAWLG